MSPRTETMSAVLLTGHGGPDKLTYRSDVPVPKLGTGEVLIRVGASAVNNTDIWTREGAYNTLPGSSDVVGWQGEPLKFPRIQGADTAGTIVEVGGAVSAQRIGERVVVDGVLRQAGDRLFGAGIFGSERDGGFAEYLSAPSENAMAVDFDMSFVELASFPTAYGTALHMLNRGRLTQGETVLVTGASGGVGSAAVQLSKARGAEVIAIVGAGKEQVVRDLGADIVVTRDDQALDVAVRSAIGDIRIDLFADLVGGAAFESLLPLVHPEGGRYVTSGAIARPVVQFDLRVLYLNHLELIGATIWTREEFAELFDLIACGKILPTVDRCFALHEIQASQAAFLEKNFVGKLVIDINPEPAQ